MHHFVALLVAITLVPHDGLRDTEPNSSVDTAAFGAVDLVFGALRVLL